VHHVADPEGEASPEASRGRRLTLRVRDVMHGGADRPVLRRDARLLDVVTEISRGGLGAVVVADAQERLLGLITDGDLRRTLERCAPERLGELIAAEIMTARPVTVEPETMAHEALKVMEDRPSQIAVVPVVDEQRCVGVVRLHDLVRIGL